MTTVTHTHAQNVPWRVDSHDRAEDNVYIGEPRNYVTVVRRKDSDQRPIGPPTIKLTFSIGPLPDRTLAGFTIDEMVTLSRALQDAIAVAKEWSNEPTS